MAQLQLQEPKVIKGETIDGRTVSLTSSQPRQLGLFQSFLDNASVYSNTIALYDALPMYFTTNQEMNRLRTPDGCFLKSVERQFEYKEAGSDKTQKYTLRMTPARIQDKNGNDKEYYPTRAERSPIDALRRLATKPEHGCYLNDIAGVMFTQNQLRRELKEYNHGRNTPDLRKQLKICNKTGLEVNLYGSKKVIVSAPILPVLIIPSREEWEANPDCMCYAQFNPLITDSINELSYRQFDYDTYMRLKRHLSQWWFLRLSHHFIQAHVLTSYKITAKRIKNDSYLLNNEVLTADIREIDRVLEEFQKHDIIAKVERDVRKKGKEIVNVEYTLYPTLNFSAGMRNANHRFNTVRTEATRLQMANT